MKPSSIIFLWLWIIPSALHAQPASDMAFKAGANTATQDAEFRASRGGFSGGISGSLQWSVLDRFLVGGQMELLYTPRGAEVVFQGDHAGQFREHYVDLTITARPELRLGWVSVYLLAGGGLDILVSASKDDMAATGQDITSSLHRVDVALLGAVGVALHLSREPRQFHLDTIFIEARHDVGLLDVATQGGLKNSTSSVMLGLSLAIGGPRTPAPEMTSTSSSTASP